MGGGHCKTNYSEAIEELRDFHPYASPFNCYQSVF